MLFQIDYPEVTDGVMPKHRFMSAYEQKLEAPDRNFQFLLFAAEPYETIGFKVRPHDIHALCARMVPVFVLVSVSFSLFLSVVHLLSCGCVAVLLFRWVA